MKNANYMHTHMKKNAYPHLTSPPAQIKEVCKRYKIKYEPNVSIGKAHAIFKVMQESSSFFVTLDTSHENYETFTNVTHDIAAVETLYLRVYESKSLLPCGQGSSSSGSKR